MTSRSDLAAALPRRRETVGKSKTSSNNISIPDGLVDNEMLEDPSVRWNPVALKIALSDSDDLD